VVSAQHSDLMAEHQDLDVLGGVGAGSSASQLNTRASIRYASERPQR
jgi:hypothetical protein